MSYEIYKIEKTIRHLLRITPSISIKWYLVLGWLLSTGRDRTVYIQPKTLNLYLLNTPYRDEWFGFRLRFLVFTPVNFFLYYPCQIMCTVSVLKSKLILFSMRAWQPKKAIGSSYPILIDSVPFHGCRFNWIFYAPADNA